jgi:hypothetical protein
MNEIRYNGFKNKIVSLLSGRSITVKPGDLLVVGEKGVSERDIRNLSLQQYWRKPKKLKKGDNE